MCVCLDFPSVILPQSYQRIKDCKNPSGTSRDDRISVIQRNKSRAEREISECLRKGLLAWWYKAILCHSDTRERGLVQRNNLISGNGTFSTGMITAIWGLSGQAAE